MSITVVLEQMVIILILILTGILLYRKKMLSESTSGQISGLIVNVTNPALLICSAFDDSPKLSGYELLIGLVVFLISYAVLLLFAYLIPWILRIPEHARYSYKMLTIFGNVGFIGIPLASAVLGTGCLIFVSMSNLIYNILLYTYGMAVLKKTAKSESSENFIKKIINTGTISALLTIIFYMGNFKVPTIISSTLTYAGRTTTFLSMLVLGVSVAQMTLKSIFSNPKIYAFIAIRYILLPIGFTLLLGQFITESLIVNTAALMLSVPAGNMPLMLSKQLHIDESTISQGIILSTILSLVTIPIVTLFIAHSVPLSY